MTPLVTKEQLDQWAGETWEERMAEFDLPMLVYKHAVACLMESVGETSG